MTPSMKADQETLRTSWTLVARLKGPDDDEAWQEFYDVYRGVIHGLAMRAGLREDEADDVVQETMRSMVKDLPGFEADPARGKFRAWLLNNARWRICDQFRKRPPAAVGSHVSPDATATTPTAERVPDPREADWEGLCDAEWEARLREQAFKELQLEVKAGQYQVFHLLVVEQKSIEEVARMVGRSRAQIYLIKHRVAGALKRIVKRLEKKLG
jgi:RNA polymerase sigma-70 factor (ECF subfamily)